MGCCRNHKTVIQDDGYYKILLDIIRYFVAMTRQQCVGAV